MGIVKEIWGHLRSVVGPTAAALLVGYFLLHAFEGDRGILAWAQLRQRVAEAELDLIQLRREHALLEARTRAMSDGSLDPDLLDEQVRRTTGLGRADELVILTRPQTPEN